MVSRKLLFVGSIFATIGVAFALSRPKKPIIREGPPMEIGEPIGIPIPVPIEMIETPFIQPIYPIPTPPEAPVIPQ